MERGSVVNAFVGVRVGQVSHSVCDVTSSPPGRTRRGTLWQRPDLHCCTWSPGVCVCVCVCSQPLHDNVETVGKHTVFKNLKSILKEGPEPL